MRKLLYSVCPWMPRGWGDEGRVLLLVTVCDFRSLHRQYNTASRYTMKILGCDWYRYGADILHTCALITILQYYESLNCCSINSRMINSKWNDLLTKTSWWKLHSEWIVTKTLDKWNLKYENSQGSKKYNQGTGIMVPWWCKMTPWSLRHDLCSKRCEWCQHIDALLGIFEKRAVQAKASTMGIRVRESVPCEGVSQGPPFTPVTTLSSCRLASPWWRWRPSLMTTPLTRVGQSSDKRRPQVEDCYLQLVVMTMSQP